MKLIVNESLKDYLSENFTSDLKSGLTEIRNIATRLAHEKYDECERFINLRFIANNPPDIKAATIEAETELLKEPVLEESLKNKVNDFAVKLGKGSLFGALFTGVISAAAWFEYLGNKFSHWYYTNVQQLAKPQIQNVVNELNASNKESFAYNKFFTYAFFIFFTLAVLSIAVVKISDNKKIAKATE